MGFRLLGKYTLNLYGQALPPVRKDIIGRTGELVCSPT